MIVETEIDKNIKELKQFSGTERYHLGYMNIHYTDGVAFFLNNIAGWIITDASVILKMKKEVMKEDFVNVKVIIKDQKAVIIYTDGNEKELFKQSYNWTDLNDNVFNFYYTNNVLMLPSEY